MKKGPPVSPVYVILSRDCVSYGSVFQWSQSCGGEGGREREGGGLTLSSYKLNKVKYT